MPVGTPFKLRTELDDVDKKLLMALQDDGRMPLKELAKKVGVSIDTVHKRMKMLYDKDILSITTSIDPYKLGYPFVTDNKIRLKSISQEEKEKFTKALVNHPRCTDLFEVMGEYNFVAIITAKDNNQMIEVVNELKENFKDSIDLWTTNLVVKTHKFDTYAL